MLLTLMLSQDGQYSGYAYLTVLILAAIVERLT